MRVTSEQAGVLRRHCAFAHHKPFKDALVADNAILSDIPPHDKRGGSCSKAGDKAPPRIHHAPVIRADSTSLPTRSRPRRAPFRAARRSGREPSPARRKPRKRQPFRRRRRSRPGRGRAEGQGRASRCLPPGPGLRLLDASLRADPPAAGALRARLALQSAAASAKILRLNADAAALRDLRFAVGDPLGPAANLLSLWRDLAGRPPSLDPGRIRDAAARLDLAVDPNGLAASLKACAGEGDPVSAAAKAAAAGVLRLPGRPSGPLRNLCALGVRHRHRHSAALAAARAADRHENPGSDPAVAGRRTTAKARRPSLAKRRRRRDRAGRRLRPRPRR